ncbi:hypothetical protein L1785_21660 [Antribacter sp. KLBMP9083]|uniref:Uncharacterized protein n=1 Tax=Antribacter soli TaxID=2910976 RepID=A0AA41QHI6_9MICO|nr:DUF6584 family protein [Antribacter soli]MCF4123580.1 hypothetical protein [Antribacter soli]
MTVERTLARVEDDLHKGDITMARTRLQSLVQSLPHRLDARERLADVCRLEGDRVEAGRWSYLSEQRDPGEAAAFERACGRDPVRIMRGLRWSGSEEDATTELARQRLLDVRARAEAAAGRKLDWSARGRDVGGPWWDDAFAVGCLLAGLVLLFLVIVGAVTVFRWVF